MLRRCRPFARFMATKPPATPAPTDKLANRFENIPRPIPLGDVKEQREFQEALRKNDILVNRNGEEVKIEVTIKPIEPFENDINPTTGEVGGPRGAEPTRFGDWERKGRVVDF